MSGEPNTRTTRDQLFRELLTTPPQPVMMADLDAWWYHHLTIEPPDGGSDPVATALRGGFAAPCLAFAFASGYQAALHALVPGLPRDAIAALCVTEEQGGHPKQLQTTLEGGALRGRKTFVTLGRKAQVLLIAAVRGRAEDGRPNLALVSIRAPREGLGYEVQPPGPFMPEMEHAVIELDVVGVAGDQILPGDGFSDYIKPFRTIEDIHVHLALTGYLVRVARQSAWPREACEDLLGLAVTGAALARLDSRAPPTHLALTAYLRQLRGVIEGCESHWDRCPADERGRWQRDQTILRFAEFARAARTAAAWRDLGADEGALHE